ncbi:MAG: hypothetical protein RL274_995 [Pseudomonadota bacterium]|jgi:glucose/arabinose dehydrogenase
MQTKTFLFAAGFAAALLGVGSVMAQQTTTPLPAGSMAGTADLFSQSCASCHGTDLVGGRGPSLFAESLLQNRTDDQLRRTILEGLPTSGMPSFNGILSESQMSHILAYIRIQSGIVRTRPTYVPDPANQIIKSQKQTFKIEVIASGLDTPWAAAFLPDGRMLVTERAGRIRIIDKNGQLLPEPVKGTPEAWVRQDGGYFDIEVNPDYRRNGWIYLSYSEVVPGHASALPPPGILTAALMPLSMTRFIRGRINAKNEWVDQQDVYRAPASLYTGSIIHYGSRFLFDGKGHLFYSIGDRGDPATGQDLGSPLGKIHRINDDGSVPKDNPFVNTPGAIPTIWSYGHRNPEGLIYDPATGLLWESEHGPTGGDEVNIIEKGHNYGWGEVSMGLQPGISEQSRPGMNNPIAYYSPSIGPSGIVFYNGKKYPGWTGNMFLSSMVGQKLLRYEIKDRQIVSQETVYQQFGRTRDVIVGPDGLLYLLLQAPTGAGTGLSGFAASRGMVIRLLPQD